MFIKTKRKLTKTGRNNNKQIHKFHVCSPPILRAKRHNPWDFLVCQQHFLSETAPPRSPIEP